MGGFQALIQFALEKINTVRKQIRLRGTRIPETWICAIVIKSDT